MFALFRQRKLTSIRWLIDFMPTNSSSCSNTRLIASNKLRWTAGCQRWRHADDVISLCRQQQRGDTVIIPRHWRIHSKSLECCVLPQQILGKISQLLGLYNCKNSFQLFDPTTRALPLDAAGGGVVHPDPGRYRFAPRTHYVAPQTHEPAWIR